MTTARRMQEARPRARGYPFASIVQTPRRARMRAPGVPRFHQAAGAGGPAPGPLSVGGSGLSAGRAAGARGSPPASKLGGPLPYAEGGNGQPGIVAASGSMYVETPFPSRG